MKIAIHYRKGGFSKSWIDYCQRINVPFKIVNCYDNSIVSDLDDCDALMWHFHQANCKDVIFAKQLIYSLQSAGKIVFPDFHTAWHFDDKVGQKYLLEAVDVLNVNSYVFYCRSKALEWVNTTSFPKVFKLRTGSGASHVSLLKNSSEARSAVKQAFGGGFRQYEPISNLKERWRKYKQGMNNLTDVLKGVLRLGYTTDFDRIVGNERGYAYFQDFISENKYDIRVIVIDGKACAIKRYNRNNDFRASGSGILEYDKSNFDKSLIEQAFIAAEKIKSRSLAADFVYKDNKALMVELSYGFPEGAFTKDCPGYWDRDLNWFSRSFNAQEWMVDCVINQIKEQWLEIK